MRGHRPGSMVWALIRLDNRKRIFCREVRKLTDPPLERMLKWLAQYV